MKLMSLISKEIVNLILLEILSVIKYQSFKMKRIMKFIGFMERSQIS